MGNKLNLKIKAKYIPCFREMTEKKNETKRAKADFTKSHKPKLPTATLFVNGQKIILNDDNGGREWQP